MSMSRRLFLAAAVALACGGSASAQTASTYPNRNVRFVVAFAPGGIGDIIGRFIGQALAEKWGQNVVIDNRGGGGGNIGAVQVARADPDGYTVLVTTSAFSVNLSLYAKPGYALSDFQVAGVPASSPNIIIAAPDLPQKTLPEILAAAKTGTFSFGSAGIGTTPHLSGEQIFRVIGKVDVRHVPFTGAGPAVQATMGGHVPISVVALPAAIQQVKAGLVQGIAMTTAERLKDLPDVPTVRETGVGNVLGATMVAFFMPAKTPHDIVAKFNADLNDLVKSGSLDKAFAAAGSFPLVLDLDQSKAYVEDEVSKWGTVVRAADLKVE
jgi:tripartite-type tricarboxylate transporter receptor subunit TctC